MTTISEEIQARLDATGHVPKVAYAKAGPRAGDLYVALTSDEVWDEQGVILKHIAVARMGNPNELPIVYINMDGMLASVIGLMFHWGGEIRPIIYWTKKFGIDELRFDIVSFEDLQL